MWRSTFGRPRTENGCRPGRPLALSPADARILDPVAELIVDDEDLVVHLTLSEKIWGFHGDIRVRLSSIVSVAPDPKPWLGLRGWRMAGVSFVGRAVLGTRRHGPEGFYQRLGFRPTGEHNQGEVVAERILTSDMSTSS